MLRYTIRRVLQIIPVFFIATLLIFVVIRALPGDPIRAIGGERTMPAATREALIQRYNLDKSLPEQYVLYMKGLILEADMGESYAQRRQVNDIFLEALPRTARLAGLAVLFQALMGIPLGIWVAVKKDTAIDSIVLVSTIFMLSLPVFLLGSLAQVFLGVRWGIFPISGVNDGLKSYIMPSMVIAVSLMASIIRLMRGSLLDTFREDYLRTAKAKGLSGGRVFGIHALRNAMIPVITVLGIDLGALLGGTIVTEAIFNIPGIGFQITQAITLRDNTIVIGVATFLVIAYMMINLVVDLLYAVLDPRIRYE